VSFDPGASKNIIMSKIHFHLKMGRPRLSEAVKYGRECDKVSRTISRKIFSSVRKAWKQEEENARRTRARYVRECDRTSKAVAREMFSSVRKLWKHAEREEKIAKKTKASADTKKKSHKNIRYSQDMEVVAVPPMISVDLSFDISTDVSARDDTTWEHLPNDILRTVYKRAVELINNDIKIDSAKKIAKGLVGNIAIGCGGTHAFFTTNMNVLKNCHGTLRAYGAGRVVTLEMNDRKERSVFRIKNVEGEYKIVDYEYFTTDEFCSLVITSLVEQFNESRVLVNKRRPTKAWINMNLREKMLSDLARETNISEYRLAKILDA
jgi:hypothetical protein